MYVTPCNSAWFYIRLTNYLHGVWLTLGIIIVALDKFLHAIISIGLFEAFGYKILFKKIFYLFIYLVQTSFIFIIVLRKFVYEMETLEKYLKNNKTNRFVELKIQLKFDYALILYELKYDFYKNWLNVQFKSCESHKYIWLKLIINFDLY